MDQQSEDRRGIENLQQWRDICRKLEAIERDLIEEMLQDYNEPSDDAFKKGQIVAFRRVRENILGELYGDYE